MMHVVIALVALLSLSVPTKSERKDYLTLNGVCRVVDFKSYCDWNNIDVRSRRIIINEPSNQTIYVHYLKIRSENFYFFPRKLFDLVKVDKFVVQSVRLRELDEHDFDGANGMQSLTISQSDVKKLPANVFRQLESLKALSIQNSPIEEIHQHAFNRLFLLESFHMWNTTVHSLEALLFRPLAALKEVLLFNNGLKDLPPFLFSTNTELKTIRLHDKYEWTFIDQRLFKSLSNVSLSVMHFPNTTSERRFLQFTIPPSVKSIHFQNYDITGVNFTQSNLDVLSIKFGRLDRNLNFLRHLTNLQQLDMIECNNSATGLVINAEAFRAMIHLEEARFQDCNVTNIECEAFANNKQLRVLSVHNVMNRDHRMNMDECILGETAPALQHLTLEGNYKKYKLIYLQGKAPLLETYRDT